MKSALLSLGLLIPLSLAITGCGGGGGGKKNPPPAPAPATSSSVSSPVNSSAMTTSSAPSSVGNSSTSSSAASSLPSAQQLGIRGKAATSALSGGEVVFTIGSQTFSASINNAGSYEISLPLASIDQNKPFVAIATGSGNKNWVQLAAYFPSIKTLVEKAGEDKLLEASEFFGVNITPLSTALYAELLHTNSAPESDAQLQNALMDVQSVRPLEGAGLILRLLSDTSFKLPAPAVTTLEFLSDANLLETFKEISGLTQPGWIKNPIASMQSDSAQTFVPAQLAGSYYLETRNASRYVITFNPNGTGQLSTGNFDEDYVLPRSNYAVTTNFSWQQTGKKVNIIFNAPVSYLVDTIRVPENFYSCDITSTSDIGETCDLQFKSIELDLIAGSETNSFASMRLTGTAFNGINAEVLNGQISEHIAQLTSFNNAPALDTNELIDYEWYTGEYGYLFRIDGSAQVTKLVDGSITQVDWSYENGRILIGSNSLWILNNHIAGYTVAEVVDSKVSKNLLVKRTPVDMQESDWVGRWIGHPQDMNAYAYDANADKTWNDGFEASVAGSWRVIDAHRQVALSNNSWRMDRDLIAIHDQKYYMNVCQGENKEEFAYSGCYQTVLTRNQNFEGSVYWGSWSYAAFNETSYGTPWVSVGTATFYGTNPLDMSVIDGFRVSANKMFYPDSNTIIEMTAADKNSMELCEYPVFGSCSSSNKKTYERGVQIKLSEGAAALLFYAGFSSGSFFNAQPQFLNALMIPKDLTVQTLIFSRYPGFQIDTISGCDGTLYNGQQYEIPARTTDCEITVTFKSAP